MGTYPNKNIFKQIFKDHWVEFQEFRERIYELYMFRVNRYNPGSRVNI